MGLLSIDGKKAITLGFIILLLLTAVFLALRAVVLAIDVTTLPIELQAAFGYILKIFTYAPVALGAGYAFNIIGYLHMIAAYKAKGMEAEIYQLNKNIETVLMFLGISVPFFVALPQPWNLTGVAIAGVIKVVESEWKELKAKLNAQASTGGTT